MSADRETNQDMAYGDTAHTDIAFMLAGAADEVEIGIAPYQAVVRGGRRRRARRWAVAAATALVLAASTGTLALAGIGDGNEVSQVATRPPTAEERHVYAPQRTTLATGTDAGRQWRVTVDIWGAPKTEAEAVRQFASMDDRGVQPSDARNPEELVGKGSFFVDMVVDNATSPVMLGELDKSDDMFGTDLQSAAIPLEPKGSDREAPQHLVIGMVAPTARAVTCTWDDGTKSIAHKVPANYPLDSGKPVIRPVEGAQAAWFVCLGEGGKAFKTVKATG